MMDLDFDPLFQCWDKFLVKNKNVYTPNEIYEIAGQNVRCTNMEKAYAYDFFVVGIYFVFVFLVIKR